MFRELTTRAAQENVFRSQGVEGAALDILLGETAPMRHKARVAVALECAENYYLTALKLERHEVSPETLAAGAMSVLWADVVGVGGRDGVEGAATARHPAFARCGKGRKHATDAPTWSAAILDAARAIPGQFRAVDAGLHFFSLDQFGVYTASVPCGPQVPEEWQLTIAREGLRLAAGLPRWFDCRLPVDYIGQVGEWASLVNRLDQNRRITFDSGQGD
jgi:hypothetical protein